MRAETHGCVCTKYHLILWTQRLIILPIFSFGKHFLLRTHEHVDGLKKFPPHWGGNFERFPYQDALRTPGICPL